MNCLNCGAMIPDGQANCPNCGMGQPMQPGMGQPMQPGMAQPMQPGMAQPMQPGMAQPMQPGMAQPMQPGMAQPMGGYQQPDMNQSMGGYKQPVAGSANINGFVNSLKGDYMKLVAFIGAFLIFIAPFFNWMSVRVKMKGEKAEKEAANMFKLGFDAEQPLVAIAAILLILAGLALIAWDLADYVPALSTIKARVLGIPYFQLILVAVALVSFILVMTNKDINDLVEFGKSSIDWSKEFYGKGEVSGHSNHGLGPIVLLVGIVAAAFPRIKESFNININISKK